MKGGLVAPAIAKKIPARIESHAAALGQGIAALGPGDEQGAPLSKYLP
jgi:hypothetical protein